MKAPTFTLKDQDDQDITLPQEGLVVVYFYPKVDTSGCTLEAKTFTELYEEFEDLGVMVIGISPDPHKNVCKFADKYSFSHVLLADEDHAVAEKYGVWIEKSMYGKKYMGIDRKTFLIQDGEIVQEWKHKPGKTEQEVLEAVKNSQ